MKYVILIHSNPAAWDALSEAQKVEVGRRHLALTDDLAASGELIVTEALADPSLTRHVMMRDGRTVAGDGPFAEVKEHLAGFYLVDCDSMDRALTHAARLAPYGEIEVRPVMDLHAVLDV